MPALAPRKTHVSPTAPRVVTFEGRDYPLLWEKAGWRLRSRAKSYPADYRTGTTNLGLAKTRARDWLKKHSDDPVKSRKGGGTLEGLAKVYLETPKRTKANVAEDNISRLRTCARLALNRELDAVTCREIGPEFWQRYQRAALAKKGHGFDLVTRRAENIPINAAVRAARCLFLRGLMPAYRSEGLDVRADAGEAVMLPEPYLPPSNVDDEFLLNAWRELRTEDVRLWLVIALARFAGLRREEIAALRGHWIKERDGVVIIELQDRPSEQWWTKTGKPYTARVIDPELAEWLKSKMGSEEFIVPSPADERSRWFQRVPQKWLRSLGVKEKKPLFQAKKGKPLHRLRGLYADHIARITSDAVTARLAAVRAAQENLGHTNSAVTEKHYLSR